MGTGWRRLAAGATMMLGCAVSSRAQGVTPVPALDLARFTGTWFEIARLPIKAEKKCVGDALTLYALEEKENHFSVVNTCSLKDDTPQVRNDSGKRPGKSTDGRLQTSYFVFLHHRTWVLAIDPNYQWALVGSPNHKKLWVYSRNVTLDAAVLSDLEARAAAQGFDATKIKMTPQSRRPGPAVVATGGAGAGEAPR